jgi:NADH-quinone oxidoreductase subunit H
MFVFVWLRGTLPRLKYDRLMDLGWKVLLPVGLVWVMATATIVVAQENLARSDVLQTVFLAAAVLIAIVLALPLLDRRRPPPRDATDDGATSRPPRDETLADLREVVDERTPDRVTVES